MRRTTYSDFLDINFHITPFSSKYYAATKNNCRTPNLLFLFKICNNKKKAYICSAFSRPAKCKCCAAEMNVLLGFGQVQEGRVSGRGVLKNNPAYGVFPPLVGKYHGAQMLKTHHLPVWNSRQRSRKLSTVKRVGMKTQR
jgi:hypothetical protein